MLCMRRWYVYGIQKTLDYEEIYEKIISANTEKQARKKIPDNVVVDTFYETTDDAKI